MRSVIICEIIVHLLAIVQNSQDLQYMVLKLYRKGKVRRSCKPFSDTQRPFEGLWRWPCWFSKW